MGTTANAQPVIERGFENSPGSSQMDEVPNFNWKDRADSSRQDESHSNLGDALPSQPHSQQTYTFPAEKNFKNAHDQKSIKAGNGAPMRLRDSKNLEKKQKLRSSREDGSQDDRNEEVKGTAVNGLN